MKPQNFVEKNALVEELFVKMKIENPSWSKEKLKLSWSNWGFGQENLRDSLQRLKNAGIEYIELHGNRYGDNLGYNVGEVKSLLNEFGIKVGGICGMFGAENDLSSTSGLSRQAAIDYIKRNVELGYELGAVYLLIVPGAVGRSNAYDDFEFDRSVETLRCAADCLVEAKIKGAVEPIRSAEVSFCHTYADAENYIQAVDHPGVQHINGDVYHMWTEESHIGETILKYGHRLVNLHLADSNRCALGRGMLDVDIMIKALYVIGYNLGDKFITPEPLGPGGNPYPAMHGKPHQQKLDDMVNETASYFRIRESFGKGI